MMYLQATSRLKKSLCCCSTSQILVLSLIIFSCMNASASESHSDDKLMSIYQLSGVHTHLSQVLPSVQAESYVNRSSCANIESVPDLSGAVADALEANNLRAGFLEKLNVGLDELKQGAILSWAKSKAGMSILEAEQASKDMNESEYAQLQLAYETSDINTEERTALIATMLKLTGSVYFVSAINTGITNLVTVSSACTSSVEEFAEIEATIKKAHGDEPLFRAFIRGNLVLPASVIYRNVSDNDISAYIEFAQSEAGGAYFKAIVNGVRSVLADQSETIKLALKNK